ncbi:MAG TPA: DUF6585 family protein [Gemmataceae bacterium]|nr:DUF6585 family protein [Gemmataceae bacterium]
MSLPALPPEHAARLEPLGEPTAVFKAGKGHLIARVAAAVSTLVLGLALIGIAIAVLFVGRDWGHVPKVILVGVGLIAISARNWRRLRQTRGLWVIVYPEALVRVQGETADVLSWKEIVTVCRASFTSSERGKSTNPARRLTLQTGTCKTFEFDESLAGLSQLRELVEEHTLEHLLHPALDRYEAGEEVTFGSVRASCEGMRFGGNILPWADYDGAEVSKGVLTVTARDASRPFCKVPVRDVPNSHVLIALAEYVSRYKS